MFTASVYEYKLTIFELYFVSKKLPFYLSVLVNTCKSEFAYSRIPTQICWWTEASLCGASQREFISLGCKLQVNFAHYQSPRSQSRKTGKVTQTSMFIVQG